MPIITELKEPNKADFRDNWRTQVMKREDMDIVGSCFALRFIKGGSPDGCLELYIEDDESYHLKTSFNHLWLNDLATVVEKAKKHFNTKGK